MFATSLRLETRRSARRGRHVVSLLSGTAVQGSTNVSVPATILALGRLGIAPQAEVKSLEQRCKEHRQASGCDRHGKRTAGAA